MKFLVCVPCESRHREQLEENAKGHEFIYNTNPSDELMSTVDVIIGNLKKEKVKLAKKLKWLQLSFAGTDGFPEIMPEGAILTNSTGAYGLAMSEHMVGVTLGLMKNLFMYRDNQHEHVWQTYGRVQSIHNSVTLILGMGDIGSEYAIRMKALGSYVIGVRRVVREKPDYVDEMYTLNDLDKLIPRADVIAMSLPSTPETYHVMNKERLFMMKKNAVIINVGRGTAIDPDGLYDVLSTKSIWGASIDVTQPEPLPRDHRLWDLPNLLITPHVSGNFNLQETFERMIKIAAYNIDAYLSGKPMKNIVDYDTGYRKL